METADSPPPPSPNTPQKPEPLSLRLPWEDRALFGFAEALIETVKLIINEPKEAFGRLQRDGRFVGPLLYGVIVSWVGLVFFYFWTLIFGSADRLQGLEGDSTFSLPGFLVLFVLWPFVFLWLVFSAAIVNHLCLMLVGATKNSPVDLEGTFKVQAYAWTGAVATVVPLVGIIVAPIWIAALVVVGFAAVHRTSYARVLLVVAIQAVLSCLISLGALFFFGAVLFGLIAGASVP